MLGPPNRASPTPVSPTPGSIRPTILAPTPIVRYSKCMYEDFNVTDRWTGEPLHCTWRGTIVAIATRHADATDIRFDVSGKPVWIALPNVAWVEQKRLTGKVITDYLAAQLARSEERRVGKECRSRWSP